MSRTRRTASTHFKADRARRERAMARPELGTTGGDHHEVRHTAMWSAVRVIDDQTRKLIDEALRRRRNQSP